MKKKRDVSDYEVKCFLYKDFLEQREDTSAPDEVKLTEKEDMMLRNIIDEYKTENILNEEKDSKVVRLKSDTDEKRRVYFKYSVAACLLILFTAFIAIGPTKVIASVQNAVAMIMESFSDHVEITFTDESSYEKEYDSGKINVKIGYIPEGYILEEEEVSGADFYCNYSYEERNKYIALSIDLAVSTIQGVDNEHTKLDLINIGEKQILRAFHEGGKYTYIWESNGYSCSLFSNEKDEINQKIIESINID